MHQCELTFEYCDVRDYWAGKVRAAALSAVASIGNITADDLESVDCGPRRRALIGGVLNGMVRSGELRVTGRVASRVKANHRRYLNQYALVGGEL